MRGVDTNHDMYTTFRKRRKPRVDRPKRAAKENPCPPSGASLEIKAAWMRREQELKRLAARKRKR